MSIKIFPYRVGSRSVRALANELPARILRRENSRYHHNPNRHLVINWGASDCLYDRCLNHSRSILNASNKLLSFQLLKASILLDGEERVSIPEFWQHNRDIPEDKYPIVCRTVLNGHSGRGIVIANTPDDLVSAPLYVRYIKKRDEYRVHVFQGDVIAVQQKKVRADHDDPNYQIRSHKNGFVFTRQGVNPDDSVLSEAINAVAALSLDFGAVDVIWNEHYQKAYVLEVNTAPGLEGETVRDYASAIQRYYNDRH